jgi:hypothetical protein
MEQTRTVWHMTLDHQRNRVLRVNLLISMASLGGLLCTLPAAFFGMNLDNGVENVPGLFWPVVQGSVGLGVMGAGLMYGYYKFGPKRRYAARLRDMRSLRRAPPAAPLPAACRRCCVDRVARVSSRSQPRHFGPAHRLLCTPLARAPAAAFLLSFLPPTPHPTHPTHPPLRRDLLFYHMDDLDSIIDAVKARGRLTKAEFGGVVRAAVKGRPMSADEVALLFRVFDQNRDAVLELSEMVRLEELQDALQDHMEHHTS